MPDETQEGIYTWQMTTFGQAPNVMRTATRANEEMAELLTHLALNDVKKVGEEIADVYIVLCGLAGRLAINIQHEINKKMAINRARKWTITDQGHGYHIKEDEP